jgi:CHAT domain-containing protein
VNRFVQIGAAEGLDREAFTRAVREKDLAERALREALTERGLRVEPVRCERLSAALAQGSAAVGYLRHEHWHLAEPAGAELRSEPHLLAYVLRPDGSLSWIELGSIAELETLVLRDRAAIGKPLTTRGVALGGGGAGDVGAKGRAGEALREALLDPVLAAAGPQVTTLFLCPDDLVFLVPLDALPLRLEAGDQVVVGDEVALRLLGSFRELTDPLPAPPGASGMVVLGGADFSAGAGPSVPSPGEAQGFSPLPGTREEAERLAELFEGRFAAKPVLLLGAHATKEALVETVPGNRYVHVATHGWFAPDTVQSTRDREPASRELPRWTRLDVRDRVTGLAPLALCGLALAGADAPADSRGRRPGILTAEELAHLGLGSCEIAVLSACETNVGVRRAGQGIQSLQTALRAAGALWTLTSLWKVDDDWTQELMTRFYGILWREGRSIPEALWQAKRELRAAGAPQSAWAGWVLSGLGG